MLELSPQSYDRVPPVIRASGMQGHLALAYGVLEGRQPGRVYVDRLADPRTALVCNANGFYLAFGDPAEEQVGPQVDSFWQQARPEINLALFGCSPAWKALLDRLLLPRGAESFARLGFVHRTPPPPVIIPAGFRLEPIDARLAEGILDGSATGSFGIDPWFIRTGGGPKAYAALGLGLALMTGDQVASLCGVCGLGGGEAEMEVGTVPAYRGQGLATIVSAAFMAQARSLGWEPAYSCDSDNLPSRRVARKLGFVEVEEIHGYLLH